MTDIYSDYGKVYVERENIVYVCIPYKDVIIHVPLIDIILKIENMRNKK